MRNQPPNKTSLSNLLKLKQRLLEYLAVVRSPKTPAHVKWLVVAMAIYLVSPIDLIPDMIPVLGITDDAALIGLLLNYLNRFITDEIRDSVTSRNPTPPGR